MSAGIKVQREGFVDYLLSGFAGAAKGAETGILARQERQRRQELQDVLNTFKEREIGLAEQEQEGLKRFRMQQNALSFLGIKSQEREGKLDRESRERIAEIRSGIGLEGKSPTEIAKELADLEMVMQRIETAKTDRMAGANQEKRADIRLQLAQDAGTLAQNTADFNQQFKVAGLLHQMAKDEMDIPTQLWLEQAKINIQRTAGQLSDVDSKFVGYGMYLMDAAARTQDPRIVKMAQAMSPEINKIFKQRGLDMPTTKLEFRRSFVPPFRKKLRAVEGESAPPAEPAGLPFELGPQPSLQGTSVFDKLGGAMQGLTELAGIPITPQTQEEPFVGPPVAPQADAIPEPPESNVSSILIRRVIIDLRALPKKTLTKQDKLDMKDEGYDDAAINFIEKHIK